MILVLICSFLGFGLCVCVCFFFFFHSFLDKKNSVAWTKIFVAMEKRAILGGQIMVILDTLAVLFISKRGKCLKILITI